MRTLADVKRRCVVGVTFRCEHFRAPASSGLRTIRKVQQNAIAYERPGSELWGWTYWPKASNVRVEGETVTFLTEDGQPAFRYFF
jgi:hypothetical protein